jgi:hypothetical protein
VERPVCWRPRPGHPHPSAPPAAPEVIDTTTDTEVEKIDGRGKSEESDSSSEELDITDLVNSQKNVETKQQNILI